MLGENGLVCRLGCVAAILPVSRVDVIVGLEKVSYTARCLSRHQSVNSQHDSRATEARHSKRRHISCMVDESTWG
jgi:hypothetical protein